jgi:hypothetical protein
MAYPQPLSAYNGDPSFKEKLTNPPPKSARNIETFDTDVYRLSGTSFMINNKNKDIQIIVFKYGLIYQGSSKGIYLLSERPSEWKIIWFEKLTSITSTNEVMNIETSTNKYEFKPSNAESWNAFRQSVYTALDSCPVKPGTLNISTISPVGSPAAGGRRNTKRSKKCKQRTLRKRSKRSKQNKRKN